MADKLKRCPFCGGEAEITQDFVHGWKVMCVDWMNCIANPSVQIYGEGSRKKAIEAWNNRPSPWHTGTPPVEEIDEDNQYCYALCFYYDGWWLSDYLFKANHEDGCFENSPNNGQQVCKFKFCETIAWQKITPYGREKNNG